MEKYDHKSIEKKWQEQWDKVEIYKTPAKPNSSKKRYILDMFPYPSGTGLHVGHPEGYTATDIYSRFLRMNGYDVLHPMGWDAFGLPAENYAIKAKIHPDESTKKNIIRFREQIKSLGLSYDWSREINTSDPTYYKWTQWLFLKLYEKGLAYKKEASVNWCPSCQTVLANEQVISGECERCGTQVVQKMLSQWFFKITDYADRLLADLEKLDWPEPIKLMQKNWIGKSEGAEIEFSVKTNYNFLILHGFKSKPTDTFYPWLKKGLEKVGYKVQIPGLPDPAEEKWVDTVLRECQIDENTVIVGHSLGAVVGMKVIEKLNHKIAGLVMVGGFAVPKFKDKHRSLEETFNWDIDFKKIKNNVGFVKIIVDKNDHVVPEDQGYLLKKELGGELIITGAEKPHFKGLEEPAILEATFFSIKVFTTRPDTIFGATYMVLAPEHPLVEQITTPEEKNFVINYVIKAKEKTELQRTALEKEKTGVFTGAYAINPATKEQIPIWIADYVIMNYGTGAIMAVPAHDQRDLEFAEKYKLLIKPIQHNYFEFWDDTGRTMTRRTLKPNERGVRIKDVKLLDLLKQQAFKDLDKNQKFNLFAIWEPGVLFDSGEFSGMWSEDAKWKITEKVGGKKTVRYKLRDWLVSRQRYWGAPIPVVYCTECGMQAVAEQDLPVLLPTDVDFKPTGESPLTRSKEFQSNVKCPKCGELARRDVDTMDTFVDSSWYFFRYTDPFNKKEFTSKKEISNWLPVDLYVGGAEHAVMHLLYARFFTKALFDLGFLEFEEPFIKLRNQGLILGPDGEKMSKSRGNVINPDDVVNEFGADVLRIYEMFMGPLEDAKPWNTKSIIGVRRFLDRVWQRNTAVCHPELVSGSSSLGLDSGTESGMTGGQIHKLIKKITEDIEQFKFNTAIAAFMEFLNKNPELSKEDWEKFLKLLAPFAPHITEELWHDLGNKESIHLANWPEYDKKLVKDEQVTMVVQIMGRVRSSIVVPAGSTQEDVKNLAMSDEKVKKHLEGKKIIKEIFVPDKLINFVTR